MESDRLSMQRSDAELYRLMRKGNRDAFAELYERRAPALRRYSLHSSGSYAVAEEVTHEVFLQLMRPAARYDEKKGSLESFLYGIARNLIRVRRRQGTVEAETDRAFEHDIVGELISDEVTTLLHRTLRELPERYRDAIVLCDLEERNYEDVARLVGCPIGTVRSRLHRARALLAAKLKRLNAPVEVFSK